MVLVLLFGQKSMDREKGVHAHTQNHHDNQNGESWTTVRRSLKTTSQQPDIISYFFTNIPSGLNETILWKAFAKHGRIYDVYMAKKTTVNEDDKTNLLPPPKPITIHSCPDITTILELSLVGELFTTNTFNNLPDIIQDIGIPNIRIKYLGGFFVLLEHENINNIDTILTPPQAWHKAAFTRIAGVWGEVVFLEKCLVTNNNLVAGKVCIHTKCMEFIQVSIPVIIDEIHVCIRIHEILGECDEIYKPETSIVKDSYDDSTTSHGDDSDTQDDDEDKDGDEDEDDLFDDNYGDDTDNELFLNGDADYLMHDGGWIREEDRVDCDNNINMDCGSNNNVDGDVDCLENNMNLLERSENNLNFSVTRDGQTSPTS
nr:cytochrome P450 [Tanacetum cinerariifolium]